MLYRAFCLFFGMWRYYIGLVVLMYAGDRFALLLYGSIEALTGMAAMWNACFAKRIDHRYTGFVLPILYSVGYWVVPVPSESVIADSALMVVAVLRLWVIGYLGLRMSLGLATWLKLQDRGPYAVVRHPAQFTSILFRAVFAFANPHWWNWVGVLFIVVASVGMVIIEEGFLNAQPEYRAYRDRVRWRLFPGVW